MIYLGDKKTGSIYLGDKKLSKIYLGDKLVWEGCPKGYVVGELVKAGYAAYVKMGLCQKSDFGPAYHKLGSYQVSI